MKNKGLFVFGVIFVTSIALLSLAGCSKKSTSPTPGTQTVLKTFAAFKTSMQVGDSSLVQAYVTDQSNAPLSNIRVDFSASPSTKGSFRNSYDLTDTLGVASTHFISSDTGMIRLFASLNADTLSDTLYVGSTPVGTGSIASLEFYSRRPSIQVKGTGGIESAVLVAIGYDEFGRRVGSGRQVSFRILTGPGGGVNLENQGYGPVSSATVDSGAAFVTLNSGTFSGTVELRAEADTVFSNVTRVTINAGPPKYLSLGANPLNIRGWYVVNVTSELLAAVVDTFGNPVENNTAVYFGTEEGMVDAYALTDGGLAASVYHTAEPFNDGRAFVWASTAGGRVADTNMIIVSGPPYYVNFVSHPASLLADGASKGEVRVEVLDINSNYVVNGTRITMETDFGTIPSGVTFDGVNSSIFDAKLTSQVLNKDYSYSVPDNGIGAVSNLTAKSEGASNTVQVNFLTDLAYLKNCNLDIPASVTYGTQAPINVVIKDRYGNPLGGHILTATATNGTISNSPDTTNAFGESWKMVFNAPPADTTIKSSTITVTDQDARGSWIILSKKVSLSVALAKKK